MQSTTKIYFSICFFLLISLWSCVKDKQPPAGTTNKVTIRTNSITAITSDSAVCGGNITSDGGDAVTERGVCWSITETPTSAGNKFTSGSGMGSYSGKMLNLTPNTTYYVRAYVKNSQGELYGDQLSFKTPIRKPFVTNSSIGSVTNTTASLGGNITSDGGGTIQQKGICWSTTNKLPTTLDNMLAVTGAGTSFAITVTNLLGNTAYYARAYAVNSAGTGYADTSIPFKTALTKVPSLSAVSTGIPTRNSFTADASVQSNEGAPVTEYGFCWGLTNSPTIANSVVTISGNTTGVFSRQITGLTPNTKYYVRAYARNSVGHGYSVNSTQVETDKNAVPKVTTVPASGIGITSAILSGSITDDGGTSITDRGFYYSTSNPVEIKNDNKISVNFGSANFNSTLSGLQANTVYYFLAYAVNSTGLAIATNELNFKTLPAQKPTLTTYTATAVTAAGFTAEGAIFNDGGAAIILKGICWATSSLPTINTNFKQDITTGTGISAIISGLSPNTTYRFRSYAKNSAGQEEYGVERQTTTQLREPTLIAPAEGARINCCSVNFSWGTVTGSNNYELQISRSSSFTGSVYILGVCGGGTILRTANLNVYTTSTASACISPGTSGNVGTWYWRVRGTGTSNTGQWSVTRTFNYQN